MQDPRIARWAQTLVHYSLRVQPGELIMIQSTPLAAPLVEAVYREILLVGAHPLPMITLENCEEALLREGTNEQLSFVSPAARVLAEQAHARLFIESEGNPQGLSSVDPTRSAQRRKAASNLRDIYRQREQAGAYKWCLTLYPTSGYAQDAGMSQHEFEEFVFDACFLNDPDPAARWRELSAQQQRFVDWLAGHHKVHILGEGTDLTLSFENRIFINSDGKRNFPSGEFFTSPVEQSAEGVIYYDIPTSYDGRTVQGIRLVFHEGKVIEASARQGEDYLLRMLDIDAGARYLGEFAFGNNARVTRGTRNILFDEKMGGTVHLALGASYPETGGRNSSALHWDMICDLRTSGEVRIDDTLFLKDGKIVI